MEEDLTEFIEREIRKGGLVFNPEPVPGAAQDIVRDMASATEFTAYTHPETAREVRSILAAQETAQTVEAGEIGGKGGSPPVAKVMLAGDKAYGRGWDAIFRNKSQG